MSSNVTQPGISRGRRAMVYIALAAFLIGGACLLGKGRGYWTRSIRLVWSGYRRPYHAPRPKVTASRPADQDGNVLPDSFVACDLDLPNPGKVVDGSTLSASSVRLYRTADHHAVPAIVNTSGGGDDIVLRPTIPLDLNTQYTFEITPGVKDTAGRAFQPYRAMFTTAASMHFSEFPVAFARVAQPITAGHRYTCVTIGPDHCLYASTLQGEIFRFAISSDGSLESTQLIDTVNQSNGGYRLITGLTFDPSATADHLLLWVSHGQLPANGERGQQAIKGADDWTGKISLLSGPNLEQYRDVVVRLPRAYKDHLNNQMAFGPDGAMYFCQASNTAMGWPDSKWGFRPERLLSSTILRLDTSSALALSPPLDVKTEEDGHYNPFAPGVPLTIYCTGIRNSYDLVWHRNGHLYAATNGSAAGGNTPATPDGKTQSLPRIDGAIRGPYIGPHVPALKNVAQTEDDCLYDIHKGIYYGHPNPTRAEYVLNGGNPRGSADEYDVKAYPVGTMPDRNYQPPILSFGKSLSPCGGIEYRSHAFHDRLNGKLMYVRYSGGGDIVVIALDKQGKVAETLTGIDGLNHFINPVDLYEDVGSGRIYVAEFGGMRITLLRPLANAISHRVCRAGAETDHPVATWREP